MAVRQRRAAETPGWGRHGCSSFAPSFWRGWRTRGQTRGFGVPQEPCARRRGCEGPTGQREGQEGSRRGAASPKDAPSSHSRLHQHKNPSFHRANGRVRPCRAPCSALTTRRREPKPVEPSQLRRSHSSTPSTRWSCTSRDTSPRPGIAARRLWSRVLVGF